MRTADLWERIGFSFSCSQWMQTWPRRYGFALLVVAAATLMRFAIGAAFGLFPPFVLFFPAIILVALLAGFGPGIFATLLSAVSVACFFWAALNFYGTNRFRDIVGLLLFSAIGIAFSRLADLYRRREVKLREFERVVQGLEEMVVVVDRDYRYVIANDAFLKYRRMKREQVVGHHVSEIVDPGVYEGRVKGKIDECFQGKVVQYELRYSYPSLGERDLFISHFPIEGPKGVDRAACVLQDVTEKKRAAEQLRASEDRYRDLVEHSEDLVCTHDLEGNLLSVNPAPARVLGYEVSELLKMPMKDLIAPEFREQFDAYLAGIKASGADRGLLCVVTRSGERRIWEYNNTLRTEGVKSPIVRGMAHDVTERKQAEAAKRKAEDALRKSEEHFRILVEQASDVIAIADAEGNWIDVNSAVTETLGFTREEFLQHKVGGNVVEEERPRVADELSRLSAGQALRSEFRVRRKDGSLIPTEVLAKRLPDGRLQVIARDVTERKRAEEALRESEQRFRSVYENSTIGIYRTTPDGKIRLANPSLVKMLGFTSFAELSQRNLEEEGFQPGYERAEFKRRLTSDGEVKGLEASWTKKDGTAIFVRESAKAIRDAEGRIAYFEGTVEDVTERRRAEEAVRESEVRFRVALTNSPITVFTQDPELRYTWIYNPHLYWRHEVIGKTDDEIIGTEKAARLNALKRSVLERGVPLREEVLIPYNGRKYAFDITIEPLFDSARNIVGITGASMDIARLREITDRLQDVKDKLVEEKSYLESEIQAELGFEEVIGQSSALKEVLKKARIVAPTDSTVLLLGETGTGKGLVARAVHSLSERRSRNFIKLNCAAVPTGLLESELFGHEKGAFTGAVNQKVGRVELADKGTLFLDEVGELPPELQPKLLRVLQDREFERLGGVHTLRVDVRIIAATNRDLQQDVANRKFREDLFYRLNVFPIELPPLRQRRADIPMLVYHFVRKHAARMGKQIETIPDDTISALENWSWPGNIRELENMIERMVILTRGGVLAAPPMELHGPQNLLYDNLTEMEREHIIRVLRETNGVLSGVDGAASRLGIKRTTLQSMLKRFGIEPQQFRSGTETFGPE